MTDEDREDALRYAARLRGLSLIRMAAGSFALARYECTGATLDEIEARNTGPKRSAAKLNSSRCSTLRLRQRAAGYRKRLTERRASPYTGCARQKHRKSGNGRVRDVVAPGNVDQSLACSASGEGLLPLVDLRARGYRAPRGSSPIIMNGEKAPDRSDRAGRRLVLTPAGRFATVNGRRRSLLHL
jgi:hypothetical protein